MSTWFRKGLETVLSHDGTAWHLVGEDRDRLVLACRDWIAEARTRSLSRDDIWALGRAIWILDRLLPRADIDTFRELKEHARWSEGMFALARRDPSALDDVTPDEFKRRYGAMLAAWVDGAPSNEALLDWYTLCRKHGWPVHRADFDGLAIVEYCRRTPNRDRLLSFQETAGTRERTIVLEHLLREAAKSLEPTNEPVQDLGAHLEAAGFGDVSLLWKRRVTEQPWWKDAADMVWVEQRTAEDLQALLRAETRLPYFAMERLARITPKDRFDVWDVVLKRYGRGFPIRLFCEWLDPAHRDLLVQHFEGERDNAACAFHAYLSMLPEGEAKELTGDRPLWQDQAIDRFLNAPDELKPPPYVADVQETEQDFRLYDPFNLRSY